MVEGYFRPQINDTPYNPYYMKYLSITHFLRKIFKDVNQRRLLSTITFLIISIYFSKKCKIIKKFIK